RLEQPGLLGEATAARTGAAAAAGRKEGRTGLGWAGCAGAKRICGAVSVPAYGERRLGKGRFTAMNQKV
ncbi:hypothetical protein JRQ81_000265, partial [Phrynocephalus forsythii]